MTESIIEPERSESLKTFGAVLQAFRENARYTQEELATELGYSVHYLASVEQGRRFPTREFVERVEEKLQAFGALRKASQHLTRKPGLAVWFRKWALLEASAISLDTYETRVVPGLLQTEAYARVLFRGQLPPLSDEQVDAQLVARLERQKLLRERPNTAYSFVIEEHLFHHQVGGVEVTRELLDHVLDVMELRNVSVQVLPLERGQHAALDGPIQLAETPEHQWLGYCEGQRTGLFIVDPKEISVLHMRYGKLRAQALTPEDSKGLLSRLRGAL
ncbi:helix-turn-helix transcriptional regulator [Streptomyces ficellus]|uniref:Helix-turn-helix transcriptional regulator n=1 Tax=Streptomyces ficellus TaxID=1977088 RepID=A0ABT7Z8U0_9ACTN|nr:helix-turn-helix transcriptional regulator [Streptomyces ficellus]MDN3295926.1 helix-turn-helix transcriptional regulator [Streptomyces ficellus]